MRYFGCYHSRLHGQTVSPSHLMGEGQVIFFYQAGCVYQCLPGSILLSDRPIPCFPLPHIHTHSTFCRGENQGGYCELLNTFFLPSPPKIMPHGFLKIFVDCAAVSFFPPLLGVPNPQVPSRDLGTPIGTLSPSLFCSLFTPFVVALHIFFWHSR